MYIKMKQFIFQVGKGGGVQPAENVTKSLFLSALMKHEQSKNCSIIKMDVSKTQTVKTLKGD